MSRYLTRQRKLLLDHLDRHADQLLTAQEIADALGPDTISLSAVYRNLADLEAEGKVLRGVREGAASYRFAAAPGCQGCLHLSCKRCGRTFHMDGQGAERLLADVARSEGFAVDKAETVLYGVCGACRGGDDGSDRV